MEVSPESLSSRMGSRLPPCGACGSQATGYHYGVNTCEACKEFFHRSLGRYKGYRCRNREDADLCVYKPGKRKSCQYCRFQRCLRAGMSKGAIKIGRYSIVKKNQDEHEIKRIIDCDISKDVDVKVDKTSVHSPTTRTESGALQDSGQLDHVQANHHTNYAGDYKNSISAYLDTSFSLAKDSDSIFAVSGFEISTKYPLSPQDSRPSPLTLEYTMGIPKADSSMVKCANSGIFIGHTSSPSRSFTPGEPSSILTPVSQSSPTGIDSLEFQPCSPTILNRTDFHGNIRTQAEQPDFKFQTRILTPKSDSSPCSWGSSEFVPSPPDGDRKQGHILQMDIEPSVGECLGDGSSKLEIADGNGDCSFRIPSPCTENDCKLCSQIVVNCGTQPSSIFHGEEQLTPKYQDTPEMEDICETLGHRSMPHVTSNSLDASQGFVLQGDIDPSKLRTPSPLPSREMSPDSLADDPSHSKQVTARVSLLPPQLPPLFANIDDVITNLLAAHKENVADFTQVPKEELICHQMKHLELYNLKVSTFGRLPLVSVDEYDSIFTLTGIDVDCRKALVNRYISHMQMYSRAMVRFARCIPGFFSLEQYQQVKLLNWSITEFVILTIYPAFNLDIGVGISLAGGWVCNHEVEDFAKACFKAIGEFCDRLQKVDISKEEMVLLKALLIMNTNREEGMDSPLANGIHWQLFQLLAEVTSRRHQDSTMALAGFMSILHEARRLGEWVARIKDNYRSRP